MKYVSYEKPPCEGCGGTRFKTKVKWPDYCMASIYACRNCGKERYVTKEQVMNGDAYKVV